jgi:metallo-beta-lactamase class B
MFASLVAAAAAALAAAQILPVVVPLGKPKQIEQARAPIQTAGPLWASACEGSDDWDKPAPPVRIHGNTYLVGTCGISSILIVGTDGDILIDSGTERGADLVANNIRKLGFSPTDVKILLHSHEHMDHVGGMARLEQLTGAQLYASANAAEVLKSGVTGEGDPQAGTLPPFPPARVDRIVHDRDQVRLGNLMLTAYETKGHTHGALTWQWVSCDAGVCRTIVYADSLTPVSAPDYRFTDHPGALEAFRASIAKVAALDCDILLTPHPSASKMPERLALGKPLLDTNGCRDYAAQLTKQLDERLAKEAAAQ